MPPPPPSVVAAAAAQMAAMASQDVRLQQTSGLTLREVMGGVGRLAAPPTAQAAMQSGDEMGEATGVGGLGLAGLATAGVLGYLGVPALIAGGVGLAASRLKFPWQTPEGEGFIAPWTQQQRLESGEWGQEGVSYGPAVPPSGPGLAPGFGGGVVRVWSNASKDGQLPASVEFMQLADGRVVSRSVITGAIKIWRPKKHIVISRDPRVSNLRKLNSLNKRVEKMLRPFQPKRKGLPAVALAKTYLSTAEKKALRG